jgi:hypothetical protein
MSRATFHRGAAALLLLPLLLAAGCTGLPKDWPIKELQLPPQAHAAAIPHRINDLRTNLTQVPGLDGLVDSHPKWEVAFNDDMGWNEVSSFISGELTPLGYKTWQPPEGWQGSGTLAGLTGSTKVEQVMLVFQAKDKPTVTLLNVSNMATTLHEGGNEEGAFVLDISEPPAS